MHLFLIRHGETVDNVAGIYAGRRDSALTTHGVDQARRLGQWLAQNKPSMTHIFASPLQRAFKTAQQLHLAQNERFSRPSDCSIMKVDLLMEKDFGPYEGQPSQIRQRDSFKKTGREVHHDHHKDTSDHVGVESKDSITRRGDGFLDAHLLPLLDGDESPSEHVVVVVSHGILLSHLWRALLLRLPAKSVTLTSEVMAAKAHVVLEHLGGWSNTGFLEVSLKKSPVMSLRTGLQKSGHGMLSPIAPEISSPAGEIGEITLFVDTKHSSDEVPPQPPPTKVLEGYVATVLTINGKHHLEGLKRTRGGIGRAQHDDRQQSINSFFKRAKRE